MRFNDAVMGAFLLVLSVLLMVHVSIGWSWLVATDFSGFPRALPGKPGPALFPFTLGILLFVSAATMIYNGLRQHRPALEVLAWLRRPASVLNALGVVVAVLVYVLFAEAIGFLPLAAAMLFLLMKQLQVRTTTALLVSVACALVIHTFFVKLLLVPLPWGVLEPIAW